MKIAQRPRKYISIAKKSPFIDSASAFQYLGKSDVKFLDTRTMEAHQQERIPHSLLASDLLGFRKMYEQKGLSFLKQYYFDYFKHELQIKNDDYVIAYENSLNTQFGPHVAHFLLNYLGHKNVSILDGGLESWKSRNLQLQKGSSGIIQTPTIQQTIIPNTEINLNEKWVIEENQVKLNVETMNKILIDVREVKEYQAGRIPNAINIPMSGLFRSQLNGNFLEKDVAVQKLMKKYNIPQSKDIVVYCMRGLRGAQFQSALHNAGYKNVQLYVGSYLEWKQNGNQIEK